MLYDLFSAKSSLRSKHTAIAIILFVSLGVYINALFNGFVYDDLYLVLENQWIRDVTYIPDVFTSALWSFSPKLIHSPQNYYRPMIHVIYMIDYHIFGLEPWGYHLTKILFHAGVSVLVFLITLTVFNQCKENGYLFEHKPGHLYLPLLAALLFAVHPVHTEAVSVGTAEVSFTFFYLLSFYLYIKKDVLSGNRFILSLSLFFLAALSKETALTLPFLLVLYDYHVRKGVSSHGDKLMRYVPYLLVAGLYMGLRIYALSGIAPRGGVHNLTGFQYFINIFPLFAQQLYKLISSTSSPSLRSNSIS
jgi:hypothetical protein